MGVRCREQDRRTICSAIGYELCYDCWTARTRGSAGVPCQDETCVGEVESTLTLCQARPLAPAISLRLRA